MASWAETDYPFGSPVSPATGPTLSSDLQITKNNPGVIFSGTESNAIYDEIREVAGDFYFATNATFSTQWLPVNNALPAFALRLKSAGNMERVWCAAGTTPITWSSLVLFDAQGAISTTPTTFTTNAEIALSLAPTWNASGVAMSGIKLNVTDMASSASSLLLDLQVGGTSKFNIAKNGQVSGFSFVAGSSTYGATSAIVNGPLTVNQTVSSASGGLILSSTPGANGVFINFNGGGTAGLRVYDSGIANFAQILATSIQTNNAYVPPVFTNAGAAIASTTHIVQGTVSVTTGSSATITLTGAAQFVSGSSYAVVLCGEASIGLGGTANGITVGSKAAGSFIIYNNSANTATIDYIAIGS